MDNATLTKLLDSGRALVAVTEEGWSFWNYDLNFIETYTPAGRLYTKTSGVDCAEDAWYLAPDLAECGVGQEHGAKLSGYATDCDHRWNH